MFFVMIFIFVIKDFAQSHLGKTYLAGFKRNLHYFSHISLLFLCIKYVGYFYIFVPFSTNVFTQASERFQAAFGGDGLCHSWETTWWGKARNGGLLSASSPKSSFMIIMVIIWSLSWFGLGQFYSFISFPNMLIPSSPFSYFHNSTWYIRAEFWNSNLWESHADKLGREIQRCSHLTNPTVQTSHKQNKIS